MRGRTIGDRSSAMAPFQPSCPGSSTSIPALAVRQDVNPRRPCPKSRFGGRSPAPMENRPKAYASGYSPRWESGNRLSPLRWTTTDAKGLYALTGIPRGLTQAYLNVFAKPPDDHSVYSVVASGQFQGRAHVRGWHSSR